jgi:ketosteroid isomerase-like protein
MKTRLLGALAGLAISFALPTYAQEKEPVDPQIRQQLEALSKKFDEASNKADAVALAALFTQDAVEVAPEGPVYGREALEKGTATCSRNGIAPIISIRLNECICSAKTHA